MLNIRPRVTQFINSASSLAFKPYSHVFLASDKAAWVLDQEAREMTQILKRLNIPSRMGPIYSRIRQYVHYTSQFALLDPKVFKSAHRISVDYYHGLPGTEPVFSELFDALKKNHSKINRVRCSHTEMENIILSSGIDPLKVHKIPIGINLDFFRPTTQELKAQIRARLGIPQSTIVIGSFQKDGNGWQDGNEPKWVKGPDIFLKTIELLKKKIPETYVLLTGPSRGYVKNGLEKIGVPYTHCRVEAYSDIGSYFHALDAYLISSRQEGGPKAVLESMASGVPLVSTRVGQAMDLVHHGQNGWLAQSEDSEQLSEYLYEAVSNQQSIQTVTKAGIVTAEKNSYLAQTPLWKKIFNDHS